MEISNPPLKPFEAVSNCSISSRTTSVDSPARRIRCARSRRCVTLPRRSASVVPSGRSEPLRRARERLSQPSTSACWRRRGGRGPAVAVFTQSVVEMWSRQTLLRVMISSPALGPIHAANATSGPPVGADIACRTPWAPTRSTSLSDLPGCAVNVIKAQAPVNTCPQRFIATFLQHSRRWSGKI